MGLIPSDKVGKIAFYENHTTPWNAAATAIGTTTAAVTDLATKTTAARAAYNAQQAAHNAAKAATQALDDAVSVMGVTGSAIIKSIRTKAATAGDSVYVLAQIPAPATPSPKGAPGTPTDFKVTLNNDGSLRLLWKCANPVGSTGTIYQVWRRIGATADFTYVGGVGTREFTDTEIPPGSSQVTYQIQGVRSTVAGPWAQFNVNFGVGGSGAMITSTSETEPAPRLAA